MVAGPRNQRYLQPPPNPAGVVACEGQNARESAGELDLELAVDRHETDLLDQAADGSRGFFAKLGAVQLFMQARDLGKAESGFIRYSKSREPEKPVVILVSMAPR